LDSIVCGQPCPIGRVENCRIAALAFAFAAIEGAKEVVAVTVMSGDAVAIGPFRDGPTYLTRFVDISGIAETLKPST